MREARSMLEGVEAFYHVSNELGPSLPDLREIEQEELVCLLFDAARFCHVEILAYTVYFRGYGMLIKTPKPYDISEELLLRQATQYFGKQMGQNLRDLRKDPVSEEYIAANGRLRDKLFNLQEFAKLYAMRFSRFYNERHHRKGQVWKQRFRSNVVENKSEYFMNAIAYIHTRPVVMSEGAKLCDCRHSSWAEALNGHQKWRRIYRQISGDSNWRYARLEYGSKLDAMSNRVNKPYYGAADPALIDAYRSKNRMLPEKLEDGKRRRQTMYNRLKKYVAENGHFLFPRNSERYRELVKWVRAQRSHYIRGTLSKRNIDALEDIGFPWNVKRNIIEGSMDPEATQSGVWVQKYELLKAHFEETGDLLPPYPSRMIGQWISYQRAQRRKNRLSETQIKLLDSIAFPWKVIRRS